MQWFRKHATFLFFLETALRCVSAEEEINHKSRIQIGMIAYSAKKISVCSPENKIPQATFSDWDTIEFSKIHNKWHKEITFINDYWMKDEMEMQL